MLFRSYQGEHGVGRSRVLGLLPPPAEDLLRGLEQTPGTYTNLLGTFRFWCSELTNGQARTLERILDRAGVSGTKDLFGLRYGPADMADPDATGVSLTVEPDLPGRR